MAVKRYELSEAQWLKIAPLLPGKASDPGRTGTDNRLFVNGCLWVLRSGAHWCDLPERYGNWKSMHKRFSRWCRGEVWERVTSPNTSGALRSTLSTVVSLSMKTAVQFKRPDSGSWTSPQGGYWLTLTNHRPRRDLLARAAAGCTSLRSTKDVNALAGVAEP
jgi:hypothetical protein